jgi:hypothetical protein
MKGGRGCYTRRVARFLDTISVFLFVQCCTAVVSRGETRKDMGPRTKNTLDNVANWRNNPRVLEELLDMCVSIKYSSPGV